MKTIYQNIFHEYSLCSFSSFKLFTLTKFASQSETKLLSLNLDFRERQEAKRGECGRDLSFSLTYKSQNNKKEPQEETSLNVQPRNYQQKGGISTTNGQSENCCLSWNVLLNNYKTRNVTLNLSPPL